MFQKIDNTKLFLETAESIINLLLDRNVFLTRKDEKEREEKRLRFEMGRLLLSLQKVLPQKDKKMFQTISDEIRKQLPEEKNVSPKELRDALLYYRAMCCMETIPLLPTPPTQNR